MTEPVETRCDHCRNKEGQCAICAIADERLRRQKGRRFEDMHKANAKAMRIRNKR